MGVASGVNYIDGESRFHLIIMFVCLKRKIDELSWREQMCFSKVLNV